MADQWRTLALGAVRNGGDDCRLSVNQAATSATQDSRAELLPLSPQFFRFHFREEHSVGAPPNNWQGGGERICMPYTVECFVPHVVEWRVRIRGVGISQGPAV
jgi:hypothetical protein